MVPDFEKTRVLIIGDIILDRYIEGSISRISPEAPVPVVNKESMFSRLGGAGNVAANISGVRGACFLLSSCGTDAMRFELKELLRGQGIDFHLYEDTSRPTISKTRILSGQHHLLRIDDESTDGIGREAEKELLERFSELLPACGAVVVSDYGKGVCTPSVCQAVIKICRKQGVQVFVDPKGADWEKYRNAACITPNLTEFSSAAGARPSGPEELVGMAEKLCRSLGLEKILITKGARGMHLVSADGRSESVKARARQVFDVSGAGDTVISILAACRAAGEGWRESVETANLAAGIVVGKVGTQPVSLQEMEDEIKREADGHGSKIRTLEEAVKKAALWRENREKIVFTNGCFDLLHPGHVHLLRQAALHGDKLVVGLNSDDSVARLKGPERPVLSQEDRSTLLASLQDVDMVVVFYEDTPIELIKAVRPDVLVKGKDYSRQEVVGGDLVDSWGGEVVMADLKEAPGSSGIIEKISGMFGARTPKS